MLTVELTWKNGDNDATSIHVEREVNYEWTDEISEFGRIINHFLRMVGYPSFDKDMVYMESITEEEAEYLDSWLKGYREKKEGEGNEE